MEIRRGSFDVEGILREKFSIADSAADMKDWQQRMAFQSTHSWVSLVYSHQTEHLLHLGKRCCRPHLSWWILTGWLSHLWITWGFETSLGWLNMDKRWRLMKEMLLYGETVSAYMKSKAWLYLGQDKSTNYARRRCPLCRNLELHTR